MRLALVLLLLGCGRLSFETGDGGAPDDVAPEDPGVVEISYRGNAPCARTGDGRLACWGANNVGQLGRGSISPTGLPELVPIPRVARVFTGERRALVLDRDGVLWAFGDNSGGELGLGTTTPSEPNPKQVLMPEPTSHAAVGQNHACAVGASGAVYCWGGNACGQLGQDGFAPSATPLQVPGLADIVEVAVHDQYSCARAADGTLRCFGAPSAEEGTCFAVETSPAPVTNLPLATAVNAGCHLSTCAIDPDRGPWCWGENTYGNLGDNTETPRLEPVRVQLIANITQISTGFGASCAVNASGELYCWGDNGAGQLGQGAFTPNRAWTAVRVDFFAGLPIDQLDVGCAGACVRSGHDVYCWGDGNQGLMGGGPAPDQPTPTLITTLPL